VARSGRGDEAKRRLEDVLWDHPYDARAALQLAEVILDQEEPDHARVQALLRRADRFGAAAEADALRERLSPAVRAEG
jgi:hypothetical protein